MHSRRQVQLKQNFAFMQRFQPTMMLVQSAAADTQQTSFCKITTDFDRVYMLSDFVAAQQTQLTEVVRVWLLLNQQLYLALHNGLAQRV